jgi:hypothetical protein
MKTLFYVVHTCLLLIGVVGKAFSQKEIPLINPSFEGIAQQGGATFSTSLKGWLDIGSGQFQFQSEFDVHSADSRFWEVDMKPYDGETFIGLVVRPDVTWERIGQKLRTPLSKDNRYELSLFVCRSPVYLSPTAENRDSVSFTEPAVVAVWATNRLSDQGEFLARSVAVTNSDWRECRLILEPRQNYHYLVIEAYYLPETTEAYAGHVLIDNARLVELE